MTPFFGPEGLALLQKNLKPCNQMFLAAQLLKEGNEAGALELAEYIVWQLQSRQAIKNAYDRVLANRTGA